MSEFMEMIREFKNVEVAKTPNFITMKTLYNKLLKVGFSPDDAVHVVSNIEIEVNENFIEKYMEETTDIYAELALKIRDECNKVHWTLFSHFIAGNKLTLKFSM